MDASVSSKSSETISPEKVEENINVSTNWNNNGVKEDGLSNDIFYLLEKKTSRMHPPLYPSQFL